MPIEVRYDDPGALVQASYQSGRDTARNQSLARLQQQRAQENALASREYQARLDRKHQLKMAGLQQEDKIELMDREATLRGHYSAQRSGQAREEMSFKEDLLQGRVEFSSQQAEADWRRKVERVNAGLANGYLSEEEHQQAMAELHRRGKIMTRGVPKKSDQPSYMNPESPDAVGKIRYDPGGSGALIVTKPDGSIQQLKDTVGEKVSAAYTTALKGLDGALNKNGDPMPFAEKQARARAVAEDLRAILMKGRGGQSEEQAGDLKARQLAHYQEAYAKATNPSQKEAIGDLIRQAGGEVPDAQVDPGTAAATAEGEQAETYSSQMDRGTFDPPERGQEGIFGRKVYEDWWNRRQLPSQADFRSTGAKGGKAETLSNFGDLMGMLHSGDEETMAKAKAWMDQSGMLQGKGGVRLEKAARRYGDYLKKYNGREPMARLALIEPGKDHSKARDVAEREYAAFLKQVGAAGRAQAAAVAGYEAGRGDDANKAQAKATKMMAAARVMIRKLADKYPVLVTHERLLDLRSPERVAKRQAEAAAQAEAEAQPPAPTADGGHALHRGLQEVPLIGGLYSQFGQMIREARRRD